MAAKPRVREKLTEYRKKRDFARTKEPSGGAAKERGGAGPLRFVVQKHAASHLHFDFRLELDGVMKSWAVPKGPSMDPSDKRLAMEVEDHPIEYNTFEGVIPKGEYGGGTVMIWDRGAYAPLKKQPGESNGTALKRAYHKGHLDIVLAGERLRGYFALVRTGGEEGKPQWLLMKQKDELAEPGSDVVASKLTSIDSGRTMEEIAGDADAVWHSDRSRARASKAPVAFEPMLATIGRELPSGDGWAFEPKWDGIRVLAFATPEAVSLITRNRLDKARQFPEVVEALRSFVAEAGRPVVLDGEIVALDEGGEPARFQKLQSRMHVQDAATIRGHAERSPAALIVFDLLLEGDDALVHEPWSERRERLEALLDDVASDRLRLGETVRGDPDELMRRASEHGWEGVIAKRVDSTYHPGTRSREWLKLKLERRQEFVVGGWTEPRESRQHLGAILLGYFDRGRLIYAGHTGGGFSQKTLTEMHRLLKPLERKTSPFEETPKTNEKAHWAEPRVVVEVRFNEWTAAGKLRQPIFLGVRDDKDAAEIGREAESVQDSAEAEAGGRKGKRKSGPAAGAATTVTRGKSTAAKPAHEKARKSGRAARPESERPRFEGARGAPARVLEQLEELERERGGGKVTIGRGVALDVTNLGKVFFPGEGYTKGDLLRWYAWVSPLLLPALKDRPLVMKRFPNGITGEAFYQQRMREEPPAGIRVETVVNDAGEEQRRLAGGDLQTLLYTIQLGGISVDPWHSRVQTQEYADYSVIDLDPGPRAPFETVVQVALHVKEVLDELGLEAALKTSGSRGIHIYLPLEPRTPNESALLVAQLVATRVSQKHPRIATIERTVKERPPKAVYVDYLQNIRAKTLASVYSARAKEGATVSMPLSWDELTPGLDPRDFTIATAPAAILERGDVWAAAMKRKNSLRRLTGRRAA